MFIVINNQTGNGMHNNTKGVTEYKTENEALLDATRRNDDAEALGIETRYEVRKA